MNFDSCSGRRTGAHLRGCCAIWGPLLANEITLQDNGNRPNNFIFNRNLQLDSQKILFTCNDPRQIYNSPVFVMNSDSRSGRRTGAHLRGCCAIWGPLFANEITLPDNGNTPNDFIFAKEKVDFPIKHLHIIILTCPHCFIIIDYIFSPSFQLCPATFGIICFNDRYVFVSC